MSMFYKNKGHYKNTLRRIVREDLGVEVSFSKSTEVFLDFMYEYSDREFYPCYGYDFLIWTGYKCESFDEFKRVFSGLMNCYYSSSIDELEEFLSDYGVSAQREVL